MIAALVRYALAAACGLFVFSLPFRSSPFGQKLRALAGASFLLALLPSVLVGLFGGDSGSGSAPRSDGGDGLACGLAFLLLSALAFLAVVIRRRLSRPPGDSWKEYLDRRSSGKKIPDEGKNFGRVDPEDPVEPWRSNW